MQMLFDNGRIPCWPFATFSRIPLPIHSHRQIHTLTRRQTTVWYHGWDDSQGILRNVDISSRLSANRNDWPGTPIYLTYVGRALRCTAATYDSLPPTSQLHGRATSSYSEGNHHGPHQHEMDRRATYRPPRHQKCVEGRFAMRSCRDSVRWAFTHLR